MWSNFKKCLYIFACVTLLPSGCIASSGAARNLKYVNGAYSFFARSMDQDGEYCLFSGFSTVGGKDKESDALLVIGKNCIDVKKGAIVIHVDADVDLAAKDFKKILSMINESNELACDGIREAELVICLKDEMPNFVTKEQGGYLFWYRRAFNPGDSGLGVRVIRHHGEFRLSAPDP